MKNSFYKMYIFIIKFINEDIQLVICSTIAVLKYFRKRTKTEINQ